MEATVHIRSVQTTISLCGQGYPWPSGIRFEQEDLPATCPVCIERRGTDAS